MKKALLVTTVSGFVPQFEMNNVKLLKILGYEVHYATNYYNVSYGKDNSRLDNTGIIRHQIDFQRSPYRVKNIQVLKQLVSLMKEYKFDLVHCHTPMGGALARIAANKTKTKPVIYTAHGFHFFKGASLVNWLIYYPMERLLARFTDVLITINHEDFRRAKRFSSKKVIQIPGVGIDYYKFQNIYVDKDKKKRELGIKDNEILLITAGELIPRKNHRLIIEAIHELNRPDIKCLICGHGQLMMSLKEQVKELGLEKQILFLGYRQDIFELYKASDIFVFPSYQEGLSVAMMEAMACGLPVICSDIRGNNDLVKPEKGGGFFINPKDTQGLTETLKKMISMPEEKRHLMGVFNSTEVKKYDIGNVEKIMKKVYQR